MSLRHLDDPTILDRYLELKAQIKAAEEEIDAIKDRIFYALQEEPEAKAVHLGCELSIQYRTQYEYTPETRIKEQELKALKKYEEAAGVAAIVKQTGYVVVRAAREAMREAAREGVR